MYATNTHMMLMLAYHQKLVDSWVLEIGRVAALDSLASRYKDEMILTLMAKVFTTAYKWYSSVDCYVLVQALHQARCSCTTVDDGVDNAIQTGHEYVVWCTNKLFDLFLTAGSIHPAEIENMVENYFSLFDVY